MKGDAYIKDKSAMEIVEYFLSSGAGVESRVHEQLKMAVTVKCKEDLITTMNDVSESNKRLTRTLFWLNIIFGLFTVIGTILAVIALL